MKHRTKELLLLAVLVIAAFLSPLAIAKTAASPEFHASTIASLDRKRTTILELTAGTTAASVGIAAIPGDATTPIATEVAKLNDYFVTALSAVLMEKYLLTVLNHVVFTYLVPACCAVLGGGILLRSDWMKRLGIKLLLMGLALVLVIPSSVRLSDLIENTYQLSLSISEEQAQLEDAVASVALPEESAPQETVPSTEKTGLWGSLQAGIDGILTTVTDTMQNAASSLTRLTEETIQAVEQLLNRLIETVAILIVLNCLIPIATLSFFLWLVQLITGLDIKLPHHHAPTKKLQDKVKASTK